MKSCTQILLITNYFLLLLFSCKKREGVKNNSEFQLQLISSNSDTLRQTSIEDSIYTFNLLPIITNLSNDTVNFISAIYGRMNKPKLEIYPKYGFNIYKDGEKITFFEQKTCANYGALNLKYFISVPPNHTILPFKKPYYESRNIENNLSLKVKVKGEIEIEAYYSTVDTTQQKYHPFFDEEMKFKLAIDEYVSCRKLFLKIPHVNLVSNKLKFYLK